MTTIDIEEAPAARWAFTSTRGAPLIWLATRLWLGLQWLAVGWDKVADPAWMTTGEALRDAAAAAIAEGTQGEDPQIVYGWYIGVLEWVRDSAYPWLAPLLAVAEVMVGLALLLGLLVGIAAFAGVILNFGFLFAGTAGANPAMLAAGMLLVLAWRNAGWYGLDRVILPALGTPWRPARPSGTGPAPPPPGLPRGEPGAKVG